ncbi:hypothetical protein IMZ48_36970 [Candidatus Bathyarchaeota archaeon]|nr:hypothetical protein [Candidatus Bathyarchaeota archaeon]
MGAVVPGVVLVAGAPAVVARVEEAAGGPPALEEVGAVVVPDSVRVDGRVGGGEVGLEDLAVGEQGVVELLDADCAAGFGGALLMGEYVVPELGEVLVEGVVLILV